MNWAERREALEDDYRDTKAAADAARAEAIEALAVGDRDRWAELFSQSEAETRRLDQIGAAIASVNRQIAALEAEAEARKRAQHRANAETIMAKRIEAGTALDELLKALDAHFAAYVELGTEYRDEIREAGAGKVHPYQVAPDVGLASGLWANAPLLAKTIIGDKPSVVEGFEVLAASIRVTGT